MEIRTLRYFLAVAREGSITRAANFLHLTQPTLSRQMQDLEQELGRQLLIRKSHRVDLTPEGVLLRKRAEEIVAMVDKTEAEFIALEDTISGDIYIGSGETRGLCPIADLIRQLRAECPGIRYHLHSGNAQDVTDRLDKGLLDFGILIQPADIAKYDTLSLPAKDVWGVLMRRDSPLAQKEYIEKADLMELPLICSRQVITPHPGENAFADWFGEDFGKLDIAVNYNLVYNAALLVEAGVGYAITLDGLANTSESSKLCFRPLWPRLESGLDIVWKKYQVFSPAAELFLSRLREKIEQDRRI
ncbi:MULTISPECIES: LysR family transcriptional regulator [unclassified Faecalibacterium]|uniref:LysR family transcriptional regulator n=1 Tax=unclassified Faecalibacterium TaxID=2646395 RepID=UPI000B36640C|nr:MULTISPECIES: LysR family transcriptional regulator [unclassified Faecalibacterium]OUN39822.1 LysR family transcriptional regulator [Faecalibacterium sp. An77]OUP26626.1 LysR family transcriptional regulator [Faecalibacterium sp. An192]OUQ34732.1 LysR family transcriptional regulator [Faecalibacterium sp. An122]